MTEISAEYIKTVVRRITGKKAERGTEPSYATMNEVLAAVSEDMLECMRRMCRNKELDVHKTLNSVAFAVKEQKQDETNGG